MKTSLNDTVLQVLQDGQWHSIQEIENAVNKIARPEHIMRLSIRMAKQQFNMDLPFPERMRKARRQYTRALVQKCLYNGKIEAKYEDRKVIEVRALGKNGQ